MTVIECLVWAIYAAIYLYLRTGDPFGPVYTAEQLAQHNQVAWIATAMLLLNVVGTLAFFLRSRASGLPLLVAIQGANVVAIIVLRNLQGLDDWSGSLNAERASRIHGPASSCALAHVAAAPYPTQGRGLTCRIGPSVPVTANVFSTLDHTCCC